MEKIYSWKSTVLIALFVSYGNICLSQSNFYIAGTKTWSTANANWSTISGGPYATSWINGNYATLESSPIITISSFNPRIYQLNCTSSGSVINTSSEILYLSGNSTPVIDVSSGQTLTLNNIIGGGLGFTKTSAGTLTLGNLSNRNYGTIIINAGTLTFTNSPSIPTASLRSNPINLSGNLSYAGAGADVRTGTLSGSGTISNTSGGATKGFYQFLTQNGTSSATITTGTNGLTVGGIGGFAQTLTGNTTGCSILLLNGVRLADGSYTSNLTLAGANTTFAGAASPTVTIQGGRLKIDNTNANITEFSIAAANSLINFYGGELYVLGNSSGTNLQIGKNGSSGKSYNSNCGLNTITVETSSGAILNGKKTVLTLGGNTSSTFTLRDQTYMALNFVGVGGTLGGAGVSDPEIIFLSGTGTVITNGSGMLSSTAAGQTVGWAVVNGNTWATYNTATGIKALAFTATPTTAANLQALSGNDVADYQPTIDQTLSGNVIASSLRITPVGSTTLICGSNNLVTNAIMLNGTGTNFTIIGTGTFMDNVSGTKNIWVTDANSSLTCNMPFTNNNANPINKIGPGFLIFNGASTLNSGNGQVYGGSSPNRLNIMQGTVRCGNAQLQMNSGNADNIALSFKGGVLEINDGTTFTRSLGGHGTSGTVYWFDNSISPTETGSGGFSAYGLNASVNLGGSSAQVIWGTGNFVASGYSLIFGSSQSNAKIIFFNPIGLDNGTAGVYNAREIYVYDNASSPNDKTQLAGVISGSANSDLVKTGAGELELNATNAYAGNTIIQAGTLTTLTTGALPSATHVILLEGILQLKATATITDITINSGATLNLNGNTLNVSGEFTNNGGTISGTGIIVFNGASQQFVDGQAVSFSDAVTINNANGVVLTNNTTIPNTLTLMSGIFNNSSYLTLGNGATIYRTGGILNSVPTFGTSVNVEYDNYSLPITTGNELPLSTTILNNLTSNNSNNIILNANATSNGMTALNSGAFNINDKTLTINNATTTSGTLSGSSLSNLTINGTANTLNFTTGSQLLHNLTLNNTATASLGTALSIFAGTSFGTVSIPSNGLLTTNDNLTIKSDINGTARIDKNTSGVTYLTGNVTIERYIQSHRAWRLLTAPIGSAQTINAAWQEGATNSVTTSPINPDPGYGTEITNIKSTLPSTGYDNAATNNPSLLYLNNATAWAIPVSTNIDIRTYPGYMLFVRGDRSVIVTTPPFHPSTPTVLRPKGILNEGPKTLAIPASPTGINYQVVGNPYASEITLDNIFQSQSSAIGTNYVMWDPMMGGSNDVGAYVYASYISPGVYSSFNAHTTNFTPGRIESGQAFFFDASAGASFNIQETDKATQSALVFRPVNIPIQNFAVQLSTVNTDGTTDLDDGALTLYGSQYSDSVNWLEDAQKIPNPGENLAIIRNNKLIAIEKRQPITVTDTTFLSIANMKEQTYQFAFVAGNLLQQGLAASLEDSFIGTTTPLSLTDTTKVDFIVTSNTLSQGANRFRIVFDIANGGSLPVTYTSIKAWEQNSNIAVQWNVQNELNIKQYAVQRSTDGNTFTTIGTVKATSTSIYNWSDANTVTGENYYRIESIGDNGTVQYSETVKVNIETGTTGIAVYPNPIKNGIIVLQMNNMPEGKYSIRLINNIGQVMFNKVITHATGSSSETISANAVAKGIYNLEVIRPGNDENDIKVLY